jgi:hypothetical protein
VVSVKYVVGVFVVEIALDLSGKRVNNFLYAVQGVGGVFVAVFLAAYLAGLPTTNVLHNQPMVRGTLVIVGIAFLVLILVAIALAVYRRRSNP